MSYLYHYAVRFECRERGSLGVFTARVWDTVAPTAADAVEYVRREASEKYELRFGGDVRGDGDHDWKTLDGAIQPTLLPCQTDGLDTRGRF